MEKENNTKVVGPYFIARFRRVYTILLPYTHHATEWSFITLEEVYLLLFQVLK